MAQDDHPVVRQLEGQLAQIRERLARKEPRGRGWWLTLTGLSLGALAGGALAYLLRSRDEEAPYMPPPPPPPTPIRQDDAIVLKPAPKPVATLVQVAEDAPIELKSSATPSEAEQATTPTRTAPPPVEEVTTTDAAPEAAEAPSAAAATIAPLVAATAPSPTGDEATDDTTPETTAAATGASTQAETVNTQADGAAEGAPAQPAAEEATTAAPAPYPGSVLPIDNTCPASHPIKGNLSRNNVLIFHVPGSNNYDRTHPEACFATEAAAEAAGFRKARS